MELLGCREFVARSTQHKKKSTTKGFIGTFHRTLAEGHIHRSLAQREPQATVGPGGGSPHLSVG